MYSVLLLCGGLAGVTTVLFGFGGGFVVVPLMVTLLIAVHGADSVAGQAAMHIAVATSTTLMIFAASLSTWRHHRRRAVQWRLVRPLVGYIAIGAVLGAAAAVSLSGEWVRWMFVGYLSITIADAILRPGLLHQESGDMRPMGRLVTGMTGLFIVTVAAFLRGERDAGPLFLSYGTADSVWSVAMTRRLEARLQAHGRTPEVLYYEGEDHIPRSEAENTHHPRLLDFFARHLAG